MLMTRAASLCIFIAAVTFEPAAAAAAHAGVWHSTRAASQPVLLQQLLPGAIKIA
jgi:hypothetical protein